MADSRVHGGVLGVIGCTQVPKEHLAAGDEAPAGHGPVPSGLERLVYRKLIDTRWSLGSYTG
jgi:hypothetical protein